jgi:hypothetical protein
VWRSNSPASRGVEIFRGCDTGASMGDEGRWGKRDWLGVIGMV